jgi:hypothetical protein
MANEETRNIDTITLDNVSTVRRLFRRRLRKTIRHIDIDRSTLTGFA